MRISQFEIDQMRRQVKLMHRMWQYLNTCERFPKVPEKYVMQEIAKEFENLMGEVEILEDARSPKPLEEIE